MTFIVVKQQLFPYSPWMGEQGHLLLLQYYMFTVTEKHQRATKGVSVAGKATMRSQLPGTSVSGLSAFLFSSFSFVRPGLTYSLEWLQLPLPFCTRLI